MKSCKLSLLFLIMLSISLCFTGCQQETNSEPEIIEKTITDPYDENFPKGDYGEPLFPAGTIIEFKKVSEDGKTTTDYVATWPNGTESVFHEEVGYGDHGDATGSSKLTTTYSDSDTSGKKTEIVEKTFSDAEAATKGHVEDTTTTTEYKNGNKSVANKHTEGKTQNSNTSIVTYDANGNKIESEEIKHQEIDAAAHLTTDDGIPLSSTEESVKITYDTQGKEATKTVTETTNPGSGGYFNKKVETEYKYESGVPQIKKRTEELNYGCNELKVYDYSTNKITVNVKNTEGTINLGSGTGTIAGDKITITIKYTNGIELTTVTENDTVTKEILLTVPTENKKTYYENTVTVKGVLTTKECEYLYDGSLGIVFKTVTTYTGGTETRKSGRHISGGSSPANYDSKYPKVPGNNGIYDSISNLEIYADGHNAEPYTSFTTKAWNGPKGDYDIVNYPYDSSVDMSNLHLL